MGGGGCLILNDFCISFNPPQRLARFSRFGVAGAGAGWLERDLFVIIGYWIVI